MRRLTNILIISLLLTGCTKNFELPDTKPDTSILVVEGDILTGTFTENTFSLSRLKSLFQFEDIPELKAKVEIVQSNGVKWLLQDQGFGKYGAKLNLPSNIPMSLRIETKDGRVYETAFQKSVLSPAIDSVTWRQETEGVKIFAHSNDPNNATRYYRWNYTETWERHAWYETYFDFKQGNIIPRPVGDQIFACWQSEDAPSIIINNTNNLEKDVVSYQPVALVPANNEKIYVRYSILVRQLGLTKEAYDYWDRLRKNTELTGTLFDAQPSRLPSNIICTSDSKASAIGYVSVGRVSEKRLFIMNSAVNLWPSKNPDAACAASELPKFQAERFLSQNPSYLPAYFVTAGGGYGVALRQCVDCRLSGGNNVQPDFW